MHLKILPLLALCLLLSITAFAQKQNVYYMKNDGRQVSTTDSADFIRVISEPDSGSTLYNWKEYYPSGKVKLIGKSSHINPPVAEDQCVTFFPSGKRKEVATYKTGAKTGEIFNYYPNGTLYTVKQVTPVSKVLYDAINQEYIISSTNDSTGKALVVDGNGYYLGFDDEFKYIAEEGNLKAGLRDGDWKGQEIDKEGKITFIERYDNGKSQGGQSVDGTRNVINYTSRVINPEFPGGEEAFGKFLQRNIKYPARARERNIQGKIYISFVVEKDGSLTDIKIIRDPGGGLGDEGVRVLKLSPNWVPGLRFGRPMRMLYTVPINFSLGYQ